MIRWDETEVGVEGKNMKLMGKISSEHFCRAVTENIPLKRFCNKLPCLSLLRK